MSRDNKTVTNVHRILPDLDFLKQQDASEQQDAIAALAKKYGVEGLEGLKKKAQEVKKALEEAQKELDVFRTKEAKDAAKALVEKKAFEEAQKELGVFRAQEAQDAAEALAEKPSTCEPTIRGCAVAYESADCNGGWKLPIEDGVSLHPHLCYVASASSSNLINHVLCRLN